MMDELLEYINDNEHLKFIVSLDNNEVNPMLYNCTEWGDLYSEYGDFGNDPMILNGDEDLDGDGNNSTIKIDNINFLSKFINYFIYFF